MSAITFICPECEHDHGPVAIVPASRTDPSYLDGDPPEQCEECGADMTGCEGEACDPMDYAPEPEEYDHWDR